MVQLEVRVTSVQIVTGFPAQIIIPEPPGWQPVCKTGVGSGVTTRVPHTPSAIFGGRGNTPYIERAAADGKVSSPSGPVIEKELT